MGTHSEKLLHSATGGLKHHREAIMHFWLQLWSTCWIREDQHSGWWQEQLEVWKKNTIQLSNRSKRHSRMCHVSETTIKTRLHLYNLSRFTTRCEPQRGQVTVTASSAPGNEKSKCYGQMRQRSTCGRMMESSEWEKIENNPRQTTSFVKHSGGDVMVCDWLPVESSHLIISAVAVEWLWNYAETYLDFLDPSKHIRIHWIMIMQGKYL